MFQHVGANDVIEEPGQRRQPVIQIGAGKLNRARMRRIRPIDAGDREAAVCQNLREVAHRAAHIEHAPAFPVERKFGQQQRMAAVRRRFEFVPENRLGRR